MTVAESVRRNRKITMITSATANINSNCTSRTDARIDVVRSVSTVTWTDDGKRTLQLRQQLLDAVDDFDDVCARLTLDVDDDRRRLVHPGRLSDILDIVDDVGDVGQMHRRPVAIGDDQRAVFRARQQLIRGVDDRGPPRAVEGAFCLIHVGRRHGERADLRASTHRLPTPSGWLGCAPPGAVRR